jgi:hypothetical protein
MDQKFEDHPIDSEEEGHEEESQSFDVTVWENEFKSRKAKRIYMWSPVWRLLPYCMHLAVVVVTVLLMLNFYVEYANAYSTAYRRWSKAAATFGSPACGYRSQSVMGEFVRCDDAEMAANTSPRVIALKVAFSALGFLILSPFTWFSNYLHNLLASLVLSLWSIVIYSLLLLVVFIVINSIHALPFIPSIKSSLQALLSRKTPMPESTSSTSQASLEPSPIHIKPFYTKAKSYEWVTEPAQRRAS